MLRLIEPLAAEGLDRARPPWRFTLVEGVDADGGAALVVRLHHVLTDGVGAVALAAVLFDLAPGAALAGPAPPGGRRPPARRTVGLDACGRRSLRRRWRR